MARFAAFGLLLVVCFFATVTAHAEDKKPAGPIQIAKLKRPGPVDFEREVLPILKANCLACHNKTTTKGELILETPQDMLKGGESGRAIIPKNGADSLLLKVATHQKKPIMPPRENKVAASDLTPEELGLLKLWIDQGAKGDVRGAGPVEWKPLPETLNAIFAVAVTKDGQYAAAARANQIYLYHLPSSQFVTRLADPQLAKTNLFAQAVAHRDVVQSLAFSPDGTLLASGSYREVKLWRRLPDLPKFILNSATRKAVVSAATSPDGKWFATGAEDGKIGLWDLAKGKSVRTLSAHTGAVNDLKFSPDSLQLLSCSSDKTARFWNIPAGKSCGTVQLTTELKVVVWLGDSRAFAVGGEDSLIRIYPSFPGPVGKELKGHTGAITGLAWGGGTNQLLSGSVDGSLRVWNLAKGESVRELKHGGPVTGVAVRGDGKRFASVGANNVAKLWNAEKGEVVAELKGDRYAQETLAEKQRNLLFATNELAYRKTVFQNSTNQEKTAIERVKKSKDADEAAAKAIAEKEKAIKDATEARAVAEKTLTPLNDELKQATNAVEVAEKSLKQAEEAVKAAKANTALEKAAAEKAIAEANAKIKTTNEAKVAADKALAVVKPKQKQAADKLTATDKALKDAEAAVKKAEMTKSNTAHELELANAAAQKAGDAVKDAGTAIQTAEVELKRSAGELVVAKDAATATEKPLRAVAFSADNLTLATAGDDGLVHTYHATTGAAFDHSKGHKGVINALAFAPDGTLISGAADRSAIVWAAGAKWKLERVIGTGDASSPLADRVNAVRFSPDGKLLASGGGEPTRGGEIKLWDWATGRLVQDFKNVHSDTVLSLDFSPDGKHLASGAADKFMRVVDISTGKVVKAFEGHTHHVLGVSWKRDGRTLASSGADNVVKIWDFITGDKKKNIEGFNKEVTSISFIGVTDQALASSGDNQVRIVNEKGEQIRAFAGGTDFMDSAAVTPDGRIVIAGGQDSILRVWNGTNGEVLGTFNPVKK